MWKFIIFIVAGYLLFKLVTGDRKKKKVDEAQSKEKMAADGEMVKDPVCGTFVPINGDIRLRKGEEVFCFCSYECRDKYLNQIEGGKTDE